MSNKWGKVLDDDLLREYHKGLSERKILVDMEYGLTTIKLYEKEFALLGITLKDLCDKRDIRVVALFESEGLYFNSSDVMIVPRFIFNELPEGHCLQHYVYLLKGSKEEFKEELGELLELYISRNL